MLWAPTASSVGDFVTGDDFLPPALAIGIELLADCLVERRSLRNLSNLCVGQLSIARDAVSGLPLRVQRSKLSREDSIGS